MREHDENTKNNLMEDGEVTSTANATTPDRSPVLPIGGICNYKKTTLKRLKSQQLINKQ